MTPAALDDMSEGWTHRPLQRRRLLPGEVLFHADDPGDAAHVVMHGLVSLELPGRRREPVIARLLRPGDVLAVNRLLLAGSRHEMTARALTATEVSLVRWRDADDEHHSRLLCWLARRAAEESATLAARLTEIAHAPAAVRVARAVERLCGSDDSIVTTQDVVAAVAGVVRVTANAELRTLSDRGIVTLSRRRLTIIDRTALARWCH